MLINPANRSENDGWKIWCGEIFTEERHELVDVSLHTAYTRSLSLSVSVIPATKLKFWTVEQNYYE